MKTENTILPQLKTEFSIHESGEIVITQSEPNGDEQHIYLSPWALDRAIEILRDLRTAKLLQSEPQLGYEMSSKPIAPKQPKPKPC